MTLECVIAQAPDTDWLGEPRGSDLLSVDKQPTVLTPRKREIAALIARGF